MSIRIKDSFPCGWREKEIKKILALLCWCKVNGQLVESSPLTRPCESFMLIRANKNKAKVTSQDLTSTIMISIDG